MNEYPTRRTTSEKLAEGSLTLFSEIVPLVGTAAKLLNMISPAPLLQKRNHFFIRLAAKVDDISTDVENLKVDRLMENENFQAGLLTALPIALKSYDEVKMDAITWAALNMALELDLDGSREFMFMRWIDELTPHHLRILLLFGRAHQPGNTLMINEVIKQSLPDLLKDEEFLNQIIEELKQRGILKSTTYPNTNPTHFRFSGGAALYISDFGRHFLEFIQSPKK